ncbi:MAG: hypothetical protein IKO55_04635 [Kiritimatiellae bacterium]|nr:hypothetical protein [Kiritimatiellia bacterium]
MAKKTPHREPPPLGLMPRKIHVQRRTVDILEAMLRYVSAGLAIPDEWKDELSENLDDSDVWRQPNHD